VKINSALAAIFFAATLAASASGSKADVIYTWETLSASLDGAPSEMTASGSITLTDAAAQQGSAQLISNPVGGVADYTFEGVESASFQMFTGPLYSVSINDVTNFLFNLMVSPRGEHLEFIGGNQRYGGFAVNLGDSDAYYAIDTDGIWTIGYGSDNPGSPCFGGQIPGAPGNQCAVTGVFAAEVSEPGTALLLLTGLALWGSLAGYRRHASPKGRVTPA
jgi:hypothetical protein